MDPVSKDVKEAVFEAEKFFSVTLAQENLSPGAEKERSLLADKFRKLKIQLGCENDRPGGVKAPPRPPKGGIAIPGLATNKAQDGEELYDDVAGVISQDDYCEMSQDAEGNPNQAADMSGENYEVMSAEETDGTLEGEVAAGENYMAMEDEAPPQEDYEEPQQEKNADEDYEITESNKQPPPSQDEEYVLPDADSDYEEADKSTSTNTGPVETDSTYEGVEAGMGEVDGAHMTTKDRSESANWDHFTKKIKPENIEGIICEGFLKKLRKEGKLYLGSRWQRRYCVVRTHVLYYFREKKSKEQAGQILLPGYKAQVANKRGREFTLTHSQPEIRAYQFESNSKEETEKWIRAINAACDAPLSERQSDYLAEHRNKQPWGDEDSLHYDNSGQAKNEAADESNGDDVYDDTNEDLYEVVGAAQSSASNQPPQSPRQDVDYEISAAAFPSTPASAPAEPSPVEPIQEEDYELPEQSSPAPPPPRSTKSQPQPSVEDTPPNLPRARPSKAQPASPPAQQQDELYEIADSPDDTSSELPQPPAPPREEENYEIPGESPPPTPPPMRPPKIPQPPIPQPSDVSQKETPFTEEKRPERPAKPGAKSPLPPPRQRQDEPPQSPTENQKNEINYANIYQALWNCDAGDKDELGFRRGDLIYIYEKPHPDWWIGSLFKPQGYSVGLVPKQYVMEAYELSAS